MNELACKQLISVSLLAAIVHAIFIAPLAGSWKVVVPVFGMLAGLYGAWSWVVILLGGREDSHE